MSTLSFIIIASIHLWMLISSLYFVPAAATAAATLPDVLKGEGLSDAPPATIPDESPASAAAYTTASNATSTTYPSGSKVGAPARFPEVNASRINRELIEANASVSPQSPGYK